MSGKAAKRARREAERHGQLKQALEGGNNLGFMKSLLRARKRTLGFALAGAVTVAGALWTAEQAPSWMGARPNYNLTVAFLNHDKTSDGLKFAGEIFVYLIKIVIRHGGVPPMVEVFVTVLLPAV